MNLGTQCLYCTHTVFIKHVIIVIRVACGPNTIFSEGGVDPLGMTRQQARGRRTFEIWQHGSHHAGVVRHAVQVLHPRVRVPSGRELRRLLGRCRPVLPPKQRSAPHQVGRHIPQLNGSLSVTFQPGGKAKLESS